MCAEIYDEYSEIEGIFYMSITFEVIADHIGIVTLNRPEAANALSNTLLNDLSSAIDKLNAHRDIRCVIFTGAGNRAFCAGADLKERKHMDEQEVIATVHKIGHTLTMVEDIRVPTIAALNGSAFGGGLELALACDFRMASEYAMMGLTETSLAIIPGAGGTQRLPRLIGLGQAKKMIYTAARIDAAQAQRIGLVEDIVESEALFDKAVSEATKIAGHGPIALRQAKRAIDLGSQTDLATGLSIEAACYEQTVDTVDRLEGLRAFAEKRQPNYKGK